jgi:hypothetical protein
MRGAGRLCRASGKPALSRFALGLRQIEEPERRKRHLVDRDTERVLDRARDRCGDGHRAGLAGTLDAQIEPIDLESFDLTAWLEWKGPEFAANQPLSAT